MQKTREKVTQEHYDVCDLCGKEISANNGNTITLDVGTVDERDMIVHLMDANKEGCVHDLIVKALKPKKK